MATHVQAPQQTGPQQRSISRSILLTLPIMFWSVLIFGNPASHNDLKTRVAGGVAAIFMIALFFKMMRTDRNHLPLAQMVLRLRRPAVPNRVYPPDHGHARHHGNSD